MPFEEAYRLYHGRLLRAARRQAAELGLSERDADVEAVVQDTFEEALRVWATVRIPWAWLYTVARRRVARCVPAAVRRAHGEPAQHAEQGAVRWSTAAPAADAEDFAAAREVTAFIRRMPQQRQQQVAYLRYVMGWDFTEIAEQLGCRPATARVHALRVRKRVAELAALGHTVDEAMTVADRDRGSVSIDFVLATGVAFGVLGVLVQAGSPWACAVLGGVSLVGLVAFSVRASAVHEDGREDGRDAVREDGRSAPPENRGGAGGPEGRRAGGGEPRGAGGPP
ncbi:RNA polymerase sigma factor [Kitasatospora sp. NPDC085464]|uniref:RNA polymerase sigma factor n=1 Tax=Kitasatospora sp. NPDC085464 TaxID=3364063 RepID=UPI0037C56162